MKMKQILSKRLINHITINNLSMAQCAKITGLDVSVINSIKNKGNYSLTNGEIVCYKLGIKPLK